MLKAWQGCRGWCGEEPEGGPPEEAGPGLGADPSSFLLTDLIPPQTAPARTKRLLSQSPLQLGVTDETCDVFWWDCLESSINVGVGR